MGINMRFFIMAGMCTCAELVTLDCADCPVSRRSLAEVAATKEGAPKPLACCSNGSMSSCDSTCDYPNSCGPPDGCASDARRAVLSDDFDDLEENIGLTGH